jgi:hypothetical protein
VLYRALRRLERADGLFNAVLSLVLTLGAPLAGGLVDAVLCT